MAIKFPSIRRKVALLLAILESFGFAGTIFGWTSFTYVFESQGYFASDWNAGFESHETFDYYVEEKASHFSNSSATAATFSDPQQDEMFSLIFVWGIFLLNSSTIATGWLFDTYGTRRSKIILIIFLALGYVLYGLSSPATPWLLFPASAITAIAGNGLMVTNVHIGNMFIKQRSLVISLLYGFFDSSGSVALIVKIFYDLGVPVRLIFYGWAACCAFLLINALKILPPGKVSWPPTKEFFDVEELRKTVPESSTKPRSKTAGTNNKLATKTNFSMVFNEDPRFKSYADVNLGIGYQTENFGRASASVVNLNLPLREAQYSSRSQNLGSASLYGFPADNEPEQAMVGILLSSPFVLQVIWFTLLSFVVNFYMGTYFFWIKHLTSQTEANTNQLSFDQATVSHYTYTYQCALLTGFLWCPLAGFILDKHRKDDRILSREEEMEHVVFPLFLTSGLAVVLQCSTLLAQTWMPILYFSSVVMAILRGFLYTLGGAYFLLVFSSKYFGKLLGVEVFVCSFTIFGQYYLQKFVQNSLAGNPFQVHVFLVVLAFLSFIHPTNLLLLNFQRQKKMKWQKQQITSCERVIYA